MSCPPYHHLPESSEAEVTVLPHQLLLVVGTCVFPEQRPFLQPAYCEGSLCQTQCCAEGKFPKPADDSFAGRMAVQEGGSPASVPLCSGAPSVAEAARCNELAPKGAAGSPWGVSMWGIQRFLCCWPIDGRSCCEAQVLLRTCPVVPSSFVTR